MKNVLVTGGAGGIGSAIVDELFKRGYNPIVLDVDTKNNEKLKGKYKNLEIWNLDTANVSELKKIKENLPSDFYINHIVTLAGRALENEWQEFEKQDIDEIRRSIELNLIGHINVIHTFLPVLKKSDVDDKSITLISSINAIRNYGLKFATKEEIARTVNFILETKGITGQNIIVDGGQSSI